MYDHETIKYNDFEKQKLWAFFFLFGLGQSLSGDGLFLMQSFLLFIILNQNDFQYTWGEWKKMLNK